MVIKGYEGKGVNAFLEVITDRCGAFVFASEIREPTEAEVEDLKNRPCDHTVQPTQLVFDEEGYPYDLRRCAICGMLLGAV